VSDVFLHRSGGGEIRGADSCVGSDCYLCPTSFIENQSVVVYKSLISTSALKNCKVADSEVQESVAVNCVIAGAYVGRSTLEHVIVTGTHDRRADIDMCSLANDVVVEACSLRNVELDGPFLVHSNWTTTPRHRVLQMDNGIRIGLIECGGDRFHAGCECRPFSEWDQKEHLLRKYFLRHGWDETTFNSIRPTFESWR